MSADRVVTLAEVKQLMEEESKLRVELSSEQKISLDHSTKFGKLPLEEVKKLIKELKDLEFISDSVSVKIADILPAYPEDVRVLFAKERLILDKKQIDQIIATVKKYA
jgi:DNA-directed RNA polymerase subunit F